MANEQNDVQTPQPKLDTWARRRRMMHQVLVFCVGVIVYCLWREPKFGETAIEMSFILIGVIVLGYVFGAVLDDNAVTIFKRK